MLLLMLTLVLASGSEQAEQPTDQPSRAQELQVARENKAQSLVAPRRSFLERKLYQIKEQRIMERFQNGFAGFHPRIGGMRTGSGFALGSVYTKGSLNTSAQVSFKGYQKYEVRYSADQFLGSRYFADARATYRNYTQESFYGEGNNTRSADRANYRFEDSYYGGEAGIRLKEHVKAGGHLGFLKTNVGTGTSLLYPAVEKAFDTKNLPGFANQPTYLQTGAFFEVDTRDVPGNPRAGGRYIAKWSAFQDQSLGHYDFSQFDAEAQQYIPFFNSRRVIALRAKTTLTRTTDGREVPFFLQPTVGGSEDLRGYQEARFRDRNMAVFNAEYRWEAFSGLDMAVFADAGQVAHTIDQFKFSEMKTAGGIGFRFNSAKSVFLRVDVGYSNEGTRMFLKFGHVF
jgi:hypothetical protein